METTLHRQLKEHYSTANSQVEVTMGSFRIDIVDGDKLIEVQHSSLGAIRPKIKTLLRKNNVEVIKPLIARKRIIKLDKENGEVQSQRWSPSRQTATDFFHELIYFTSVFPHKRLTMRIPLIEIEELRFPFRRRWFRGQFKVQDQMLLNVVSEDVYGTNEDLLALLPTDQLPKTFDTGILAEKMEVERWYAQKVAYCLRKTGAVKQVGKKGNSLLYELSRKRAKRTSKRKRTTAA